MKKVRFRSEGLNLVGSLYHPADFDAEKQYPAIVVSGSWTTVKEQMAGLYADKLAQNGFITLAFDFRNYGESEGEPRFYESPALKVADIQNAVSFLQTLPEVDSRLIGAFGVCAGAGYTLAAASQDGRIAAIVTAASWLHDSEAVKMFYGGEAGVRAKIDAAQAAKKNYAENGVIEYIPTISTTDETAAMYGPYDYYLNPERGAVPEWSAEQFAVMSWEDWLTFDPTTTAKDVKAPTLMIHSDGAVLPTYTKQYFEKLGAEDKSLYWVETDMESPFHQFNFYDQEAEVSLTVDLATQWFSTKLSEGQRNKEKVREFFRYLEQEDIPAFVDLFAENGRQINPYHSNLFPTGAVGKEELLAYWEPVPAQFDGMSFHMNELMAMEDPKVIFARYRGEIKLHGDAGVYANDYYSTFRFNEAGKILEYVEIFNPIVAARGFGLLDQINQN